MTTTAAKKNEVPRKWFLVDAEGETLGRIAARIAMILQGKHKPIYTPHVDTGDFVVVINAEKIGVTGRKIEQKIYRRYSGYPGGMKEEPLSRVLERHPERAIRSAVRGMLPKTRLGRRMLRKLKVYAGPEHPHEAQQPIPLKEKG